VSNVGVTTSGVLQEHSRSLSISLRVFCGDGIRTPGEGCDDGNELDSDGCNVSLEKA
jgi:cysteine-rich repeat protein